MSRRARTEAARIHDGYELLAQSDPDIDVSGPSTGLPRGMHVLGDDGYGEILEAMETVLMDREEGIDPNNRKTQYDLT